MNDWNKYLGRVDSFCSLAEKERETLLLAAREKRLEKGRSLFSSPESEEVIIILDGAAKSFYAGGLEKKPLLDFHKSGEVLGEESALLSGPRDVEALAMGKARALCFPADEVRAMMDAQPRFGRTMSALCVSRARACRARLYSMTADPVPVRVAGALYALARKFGERGKTGTMIALAVTHRDVADYVGASREATSSVISIFRKNGLITGGARRIIIPDMNALKRASERNAADDRG